MREETFGELLALARAGGGTAAFDADGTLWADDIGEAFLRELEGQGRVPAGAWAEYERLVAFDPAAAYGHSVEVMAGLRDAEVTALAAAFYDAHFAPRLFPEVHGLLRTLLSGGIRVCIVSASCRWLVEAAGRALGVPLVAAVDVELEDGRLSSRLIRPLPEGEGKVHWAHELLGAPPALAVGNGEIDLPMLRSAAHRVVICPAEGGSFLEGMGRQEGWPVWSLGHPCPKRHLP